MIRDSPRVCTERAQWWVAFYTEIPPPRQELLHLTSLSSTGCAGRFWRKNVGPCPREAFPSPSWRVELQLEADGGRSWYRSLSSGSCSALRRSCRVGSASPRPRHTKNAPVRVWRKYGRAASGIRAKNDEKGGNTHGREERGGVLYLVHNWQQRLTIPQLGTRRTRWTMTIDYYTKQGI